MRSVIIHHALSNNTHALSNNTQCASNISITTSLCRRLQRFDLATQLLLPLQFASGARTTNLDKLDKLEKLDKLDKLDKLGAMLPKRIIYLGFNKT